MAGQPTPVPIELIDVPGNYPRHIDDAAVIHALADDMRDSGLEEAIIVDRVGSRYVLKHGRRRLEAAKWLSWTTIPVKLGGPEDKPKRHVTPTRADSKLNRIAIQKLLDEGETNVGVIARRVGIAATTAYAHLEAMGAKLPRRPPLDVDEAVRLRKAGVPTAEIAVRLDYSYATIAAKFKELGLTESKEERRQRLARQREEILRLHGQDMNAEQIARQLGVNPSTVRNRLHEAGLGEHVARERRRQDVWRLYQLGFNRQQIGDKLRLNKSTIHHDIAIMRKRHQLAVEAEEANPVAANEVAATIDRVCTLLRGVDALDELNLLVMKPGSVDPERLQHWDEITRAAAGSIKRVRRRLKEMKEGDEINE